MSSIELGRLARRVDTRLALMFVLMFSPVIGAALFLSHAYAAHELMEETGRSLDQQALGMRQERPLAETKLAPAPFSLRDTAPMLGETGFWILDANGRVLVERGPSLRDRPSWDPEPMWNALWVRRGHAIRREADLPNGDRLVLAVLADHFVGEREELVGGFWMSLAFGLLGGFVASLAAARVALGPLRSTTSILQEIDAGGLDARVPERDTADDVDRHAIALNGLLDRLEAGFERIRAFSSDVAHELRTPVNRMLNRAEIAALEAPQDSREQQVLLELREAAEELSRVISSLLVLAQADTKRLAMTFEPISVPSLFEGLRDLYDALAHDHGLQLQIDAGDVAVRGDQTLLTRAIANLIDNAIRFAPGGSTVCLRGSRVGEEGLLEVEDAGPGMEAVDLERIFDRFVRLDQSTPGSGLGLAIAKALVEAQGGRIEAGRSSLGGTRMQVWLPLAHG